MKTKLKIILLGLVFIIGGCKGTQNESFHSANVAYISNDERETITLRSTEFGKNEEEAIKNAHRLAFQNLFFRGVPGSPYKDPMLGIDEKSQFDKHSKYLNEFYDSRMYTFINNSKETISKDKRRTKATVYLTINMRALREDLQTNNLMPKFGI